MFQHVIKEDKCSNCKSCLRICPKNVFEADDEEVKITRPYYCTGCESCVEVCPLNALKVEEY